MSLQNIREDEEHPSCCTDVMHFIETVVNTSLKQPWAIYFKNPVNSIDDGMHNYYAIVKHPMDLDTIKERLGNNYYRTAHEVIKDIKFIYRNCMWFHKRGCVVHKAGKKMRGFFYENLFLFDLSNEIEVACSEASSSEASSSEASSSEASSSEENKTTITETTAGT